LGYYKPLKLSDIFKWDIDTHELIWERNEIIMSVGEAKEKLEILLGKHVKIVTN
jgi:hypothetical protein